MLVIPGSLATDHISPAAGHHYRMPAELLLKLQLISKMTPHRAPNSYGILMFYLFVSKMMLNNAILFSDAYCSAFGRVVRYLKRWSGPGPVLVRSKVWWSGILAGPVRERSIGVSRIIRKFWTNTFFLR